MSEERVGCCCNCAVRTLSDRAHRSALGDRTSGPISSPQPSADEQAITL